MGGPRLYLEEGDPHQDPGHHDQIILQPLLKLAHTAFGVDGALLLQLLRRHGTRLSLPASAQIYTSPLLPPCQAHPCSNVLPNNVCSSEFCHRAFARMAPPLGLSLAGCSEEAFSDSDSTYQPSKSSADLSQDCPFNVPTISHFPPPTPCV